MAYSVVKPDELEWVTRPPEPGGGDRHVAAVTEPAGLEQSSSAGR